MLMTDFGIEPPKAMLGMLKTDPKVTVTFETVLGDSADVGARIHERIFPKDTTMRRHLRIAIALSALLALAAPAAAQQITDPTAPPAVTPVSGTRDDPAPTTAPDVLEKRPDDHHPVLPAAGQARAQHVRDDEGSGRRVLRLQARLRRGFTSQVQSAQHRTRRHRTS